MTATARRRWLIPAATLALLVAGTVAVSVALTVLLSGTDTTEGPSGTRDAPLAAGPSPDDSTPSFGGTSAPGPVSRPITGPVSELVDPGWVASTARATVIPERALAAYAGAAIAAGSTYPDCGLGWNTLAAIGLIESEHGAVGGSRLAEDGTVAPGIIGVPLDGNDVAKIPDTDHGKYDEDTTWDRAVGPMQFIPSTWTAYAADGNGDRTPDIHNLDDAALTAGLYLCATGGNLTQPDNWITAVAAYNPDTDYNNRVAKVATTYATEAPR